MSREWTPAEALGPYRLVERLAAGGMGEVWRAWDGRLKRPVAVKHVLPEILDQPGARARFRREAEAGARLTHPAVVQIYDLVEAPDGDWLVMELVVGKTLRQLLSAGPLAGPLPIRSAVLWGGEIARGLAAAHAEGILHRDLKAGNVMITAAGHAKILDFGIARALFPEGVEQEVTLSHSGTVVGTSYAMSPEQVLGLPLDPRSDLFSLGSLLYEMLTGEAPFRAASAAATLARVCNYRPLPAGRLCAEVPAEVSALIERLLEKEPNARPRNADEVAACLEEATARMALRLPTRAAPRQGEPRPPPAEATIVEGRPRGADFESSSATFPRGRRVFLRSGGFVAGALLLVLALVWQGGRLAAPHRTAGTYELYEQGLAALRRYDKPGNLDEAITDFRQIIGRDPNHAAAHAALARACQLKFVGQSKDRMWLDQALPLAERAVALDGYLASARVSLGLVYTSVGRLDEARREIEKASQLEPGNADAQYALGNLYEARTQLDLAETAYQRAIALRPDRQFYDALGALYQRTGRLPSAIVAFQSSIRLAPDGIVGYRNLGTAYYLQGDLAQAAAQFQKALEIEPQPSLYSNLGTLYFAQGLYPQAAQAFEQALELPGGANSYLLWGNLGDASRFLPEGGPRARDAYSRALQLLADPLRAAPRDSTLLSRRAVYLAKRGDCGPALAAGGEIERLAQKDATAQFRLVVTDEVCGRRDAALAVLERALHNGFPLSEVQRDPELLALRGDVRYHRLLVRLTPASTAP
ncbi:MAG: eukaryotic-like serine/threonine-protein kinase [Acidobacteriota bacterium]|jgi:serine/threonine-protein kinase|nr:eukaryotic-like serine/threonine-protein kinase [Acidobacteriota bacterium]